MPGPYHIEKGIVCQDSHCVKYKEDVIVAAVADGLGSEMFSNIGSQIVSEIAVDFCLENFDKEMIFDEVKKIMNNSFVHAWQAVANKAHEDKNSIDEYDTTLCLAIFTESKIYFGQSGDSGLIVMFKDGSYKAITRQQRDESGCVFPLCFGPTYWQFGEVDNVYSFMLATDGVYEEMVPPILNRGNSDEDQLLNIPNVMKFLNRNETSNEDVKKCYDTLYQYIELYPEYALNDDKTVIVVWDEKSSYEKQSDEYYKPIDWDEIYSNVSNRIDQDYKESTENDGKETSLDNDDVKQAYDSPKGSDNINTDDCNNAKPQVDNSSKIAPDNMPKKTHDNSLKSKPRAIAIAKKKLKK